MEGRRGKTSIASVRKMKEEQENDRLEFADLAIPYTHVQKAGLGRQCACNWLISLIGPGDEPFAGENEFPILLNSIRFFYFFLLRFSLLRLFLGGVGICADSRENKIGKEDKRTLILFYSSNTYVRTCTYSQLMQRSTELNQISSS